MGDKREEENVPVTTVAGSPSVFGDGKGIFYSPLPSPPPTPPLPKKEQEMDVTQTAQPGPITHSDGMQFLLFYIRDMLVSSLCPIRQGLLHVSTCTPTYVQGGPSI